MLRAEPVAVGEPVERHQHHRDPDRRLEGEDEVEEGERVAVPWVDQVEGVEADPDDHDPELGGDEDPAADEAGEIVGDAIGECLMAIDLAIQVTHRRMVVLVLDQVAGYVFDFSGDRHGFSSGVAAMNSGCNRIAWSKDPTSGYRK